MAYLHLPEPSASLTISALRCHRLWHTLLMYDYGEANHLASLSDKEYLQSDYWQVFTHWLKQSCHSQGNPLDDLELQARPLCPRPLRGQEIILPQLFLQR